MVARLVRSAARRWPELSIAELESIGNEAAVRAACVFDPSKGVPFEAYAYRRVQGELRRMAAHEALGHRAGIEAVFRVDGDASEQEPQATSLDEAMSDTPECARARAVAFTRREAAALVAAALLAEGPLPADEQLDARQARARALAALEAAVDRLPEPQSQLVELHYKQGLTLQEIAERFGRSTRTVQRLHEAVKERLAQALTHAGVSSVAVDTVLP
jgi:RNA polymerase sigma factor for flagellar operon FliA